MSDGLRITRRFTEAGKDPYDQFEWSYRDSKISNPDGSVVFEMNDAEIPARWSQVASDIMVSKYFRKAGVPQVDKAGNPVVDEEGNPVLGPEQSSKQVFNRLAGTWRHWGEKEGYFASTEDAEAFEDELKYMLANQMASPNSPQWFNTGLNWAYGLTGSPQGFWFVDSKTGELTSSPDAYTRPAPHACFINEVSDDLVSPGGIMDLWMREARLFKMGSGTGSNFSNIRSENEPLSGGGKSSGVMSFLKIGDRAAGAIKCLHEDTEIVTSEGTFRISDLEPGDAVATRYGLREITAVHDNGIRPLVRIRTELGDDILATPEHRFWIRNAQGEGWKAAGDLAPDDYVAVDLSATPSGTAQVLKPVEKGHHNERSHDLPLVLNEPFALWLGWVFGDGSITTTPSSNFIAVQIGDDDPELIERYTELTKTVFGGTLSFFVNRRSDGRTDRSASVRTCSSQVIRFLEYNGLRKAKAADVEIPWLVKSSPAPVRAAFLSGLFEADGHVDNGYPVLSTISDKLAQDVHQLLIGLGIPSRITVQSNRKGAIGDSPINLVRVIGGEGVRRFSKIVGFVSERKQSRLDSAVDRKNASPYETQWVIPHVIEEMDAIWHNASPRLRRAVAPYCRYKEPRSLSLLRAQALMHRFPDELTGTLVEKFAAGETLYQRVSIEQAGEGPVFDLTIADIHEYTVHGLITHNSGGTTRRAAKMVILDADHPDIEEFVDWKKIEEEKARILIQYGGFPADFNGEAYATVSGQNSNNSVRVTNAFVQAVLDDTDWNLINRTDGSVRKTIKARDLWNKIAEAAWACADPGIQFDTIVNEWHTSPAGGRIRATNPCSEYNFLDNTACNLASINLVRFLDQETGVFDVEGYQHTIRLWTMVLEISVAMAHFPSQEIAQGSYDYRTLGLGYANLGSLLMRKGIAYDSDEGRAMAAALTAILTGFAYATSAEIAAAVGPFPRFEENRHAMLRVIRNHRRAAYNADLSEYEGVSHYVMGVDPDLCPENVLVGARDSWDRALALGEEHGYRNAQASVLAPTGTIGLQLDCDTTGVEPDFALVKFKKLAGGGYFKIVNQSVAPALTNLGYSKKQLKEVVEYIVGTNSIEDAPHINWESLSAKGFMDEDLEKLEKALPSVFELRHAFNVFTFGEETLQKLGFTEDQYTGWEFNLLKELGFTSVQITEANDHICGRGTIEGAPHIKDEHLPVFDTANKNGKYGQRYIHHTGHLKMLAAVQPQLSGSASKTINLPNEATVEDIEESYMMAWEYGVKCIALYRDGSKAAQPLSSTSDEGDDNEDEAVAITDAVEVEKAIHWGNLPKGISPTAAYAQGLQPPRFMLPAKRRGFNQEARVGGHKVYLRTGEYDDGTLGEIFIDLAKEGATLKGILSCFAIAVSKGLQYGVPLEEFVDTFTFQTFEPRGMVEGHPNIKMANSIIDYVFRALGVEYLERDELAQVPPDRELAEPPKGLAVEAGVQFTLDEAAGEIDIDALQEAADFVDSDSSVPPLVGGPSGRSSGEGGVSGANSSVSVSATVSTATMTVTKTNVADLALRENMGDAPACSNCGHMTVRNGSCYVCLTCGDTTGCS